MKRPIYMYRVMRIWLSIQYLQWELQWLTSRER